MLEERSAELVERSIAAGEHPVRRIGASTPNDVREATAETRLEGGGADGVRDRDAGRSEAREHELLEARLEHRRLLEGAVAGEEHVVDDEIEEPALALGNETASSIATSIASSSSAKSRRAAAITSASSSTPVMRAFGARCRIARAMLPPPSPSTSTDGASNASAGHAHRSQTVPVIGSPIR
jgi:hypothetical protein